ncbi:hypothetical protein JCM1840_004080 [Sporobolomyces johnsonii]
MQHTHQANILIHAHPLAFTPSPLHTRPTPPSLLDVSPSRFTLILDCTDNPATRHFLNAYAVAKGVPPSAAGRGAADERSPCYACIFPPAPLPAPATGEAKALSSDLEADLAAERASLAGTGACADEGVLGILCGVVGLGMAGEAVKVLLGAAQPTLQPFAPLSPSPYRTIKTRPRKPTCPSCGTFPSSSSPPFPSPSTPQSRWSAFLRSESQTWLGWVEPLCALPAVGELAAKQGRRDARIKVDELRRLLEKGARVVDTRPEAEFGIASVEGSVNIPFARLHKDPSLALSAPAPSSTTVNGDAAALSTLTTPPSNQTINQEEGVAEEGEGQGGVKVIDVVGGLNAWANDEDGERGFPVY